MKRPNVLENLMSNQITFLKVSLLVLLSLSMLQCSFKKDDDNGKDKEPQLVIKEQVETTTVKGASLALQVIPGEQIHIYGVRISWAFPANCQGKIQKRGAKSGATENFNLESNSREMLDRDIQEGDKYFYTLICSVNGAERAVETLSILVPKDLTLSGEVKLSNLPLTQIEDGPMIGSTGREFLIRAPRILLRKDLQLKTEGYPFQLAANFIEAEAGATIYTFLEAVDTSISEPGKSGGRIRIEAKAGVGMLDLRMNGQDGGTGLTGSQQIDFKVPPKEGSPGKDAVYRIENAQALDTPPDFQICDNYTPPRDGGGGKGGRNDRFLVKTNCKSAMFECIGHATNGTDGGPGLKGLPGSNGFNGGSSGVAEIRVLSGDFRVKLRKRGGAGGSGGRGGPGSIGGAGGAAGDGSVEKAHRAWLAQRAAAGKIAVGLNRFNEAKYCNPGKPGARGPQGPEGDMGGPGQNGLEEKSLIWDPKAQRMDEL